ncbi:MAG: HD domain-containing protein [Bacteroidetes bacterium]|nr:HD domain-containing protein [Bacteroidota bacterium]
MNKRIAETIVWVKKRLESAESGHDWWHIQRVYRMAMQLAEQTGADAEIVGLAALLHDLTDSKLTDRPAQMEAEIEAFLRQQHVSQTSIAHIMFIIRNMSFRHASVFSGEKSVEFQVVQDADRLDAMGAIGIARAFSYGGYKKRPFMNYNSRAEAEKYFMEGSFDSSTIGHFYEKLFRLKEMMNTDAARRMAEERHNFMLIWLDRFYEEWEGKA